MSNENAAAFTFGDALEEHAIIGQASKRRAMGRRQFGKNCGSAIFRGGHATQIDVLKCSRFHCSN
jgi:hypothetical protein